MTCYHPLKAFDIGRKTKDGKIDYYITGYDAQCVQVDLDGHVVPLGYMPRLVGYKNFYDFIEIPCGKCFGCRLKRARDWSIRMMLETEYHDESWFVTLTYNDDHINYNKYIDDDGVIQRKSTLAKKDLQLFWKRLRKKQNIRYYACGEYGSRTARPHYHAIIFGLHLDHDKLVPYKSKPYQLYQCPELEKIWKYGFVVVGKVTQESCEYVARYCMKKLNGEAAEIYKRFNFDPEFSCMSLKPAIGRQWFDDYNSRVYPNDEIQLSDGRSVKPPRYFDTLMDKLDEDLMSSVKDQRADIAAEIERLRLAETGLTKKEYLKVCEENMKMRTKKLVRPLD